MSVSIQSSVTFSVTAASGTTMTYQWRKGGVNISGATANTYTISSVQTTDAGVYSVQIVNAGGSVISANATLSILVAPSITTQPLSQTVASQANVTLTVVAAGSTPLTYQWYYNGAAIGGATAATLALNKVTTAYSATYSVKVSNAAGSVTSAGAVLTVLTPPGITTQPKNATEVLGQNATFSVTASGSAPLIYQWNFGGSPIMGETNSTLALTAVQAAQAGNYTVAVSNAVGNVTSGTATLTVVVPVSITTQPQSQAVASRGNASFSVAASGTAPLTYQWYFNGATIPGPAATAATYAINNAGAPNAGSYTVVVANTGSSLTSAVATLTVVVAAGIATQPQNQTVLPGQNASFAVVANGTAPFSYQWEFNGSPLADSTNATLTLTNVQAIQAGSYTVVVSNVVSSVSSVAATLTVSGPASIVTQPSSQSVASRGSASFSVLAAGSAPLTYQWSFNGTAIPGPAATAATYTLNNVGPANAGNYTVVVANSMGSATSVVASLTVLVAPAIATQPQNQSGILGQTASFSVVASGTAPLSYQWNFNGSPLAGATNSTLALSNLQTGQAGNYTVIVTNLAGSATSANAALTVNIPPSITTQPQSEAVASKASVAFSVAASGTAPLTYQWLLNGALLPGDTASTLTLKKAASSDAGNYSVVIANPAGSVTSVVAILTVDSPPLITTQPQPQTAVTGQGSTFSVAAFGEGTLSYQWNLNGSLLPSATNSTLALTNVQTSDAGSYAVVVANLEGSVTSAVATLTVLVPAQIIEPPQNQSVIQNQNASFSVVANGTAPITYQWTFNGSPLTDATNSLLALTNVQTSDAGNYTVIVANAEGSVTSAVVTLTVLIPAQILEPPQNQSVIQNQNASFSVVANGTAPITYQWNFNGSPLTDATNSLLALTNVQTSDAGSYTVVVANAEGSVTSAVVTLTVLIPAQIVEPPQNQSVIQNQNASFSVVANGTAPITYQWNFNGLPLTDATNSLLALTNVQTADAGSYTVVVANLAGSVTSAVATLTVVVPVQLITQPQSITVVQGQSPGLSVVAGGTAPFTYQWSYNGSMLPDATNFSLMISNIQTNQAGDYQVVVANLAGSVTSLVATITVLVPPQIDIQPQSQSVLAGQAAAFNLTAEGTGPLSYQWALNGAVLSGETNAAMTINNAWNTNSGSYTVTVTNAAGSVISSAAVLTVAAPALLLSPGNAAGLSSGNFNFQLSVPPGCTYIILTSTNLQDWTPLCTNVAASSNESVACDTANDHIRFYKALVH